jgi:CelD/BcsL family acetyltransferase involved in cellulose biosynthesis
MKKTISVDCVQDIKSFEELRITWNNVLFSSQERDVFLTWEWLFSWWKNIGQAKYQLKILVIKEDEQVIGIAPWMVSIKNKAFIKLRWIENIGNPDCDVCGIITATPQKTLKAITEYLDLHRDDWEIVELQELPSDNQNTSLTIQALRDNGYDVIQTEDEHYYIEMKGSWEEYYNSLSKNLKHNFKRRMNRAKEMGSVTIERHGGATLAWEHYQTIFKINEKSNFPYLYKNEQDVLFHKELFNLMKDQNWVQIEIFKLNDIPIAYQYGFTFEKRYEDWRGGIDKDYETLAPGKLLMMHTLEERYKEGYKENDFLRGDHTYKKDWLPQARKFTKIQVYNPKNIKSRLAYIWVHYIRDFLTSWKKTNDRE